MTKKFDDLNPLRSTKGIVTLENGPRSFGTLEKRAPEPSCSKGLLYLSDSTRAVIG